MFVERLEFKPEDFEPETREGTDMPNTLEKLKQHRIDLANRAQVIFDKWYRTYMEPDFRDELHR